MERRPIIEGLFTWPSENPQLIGSKCKSCNTFFFPKISTCPNPECDKKEDVEEVLLSRRGKIHSYTIQQYKPPPPFLCDEPYEPFAIGIIELPEGIRVIGILTETDVKIGDEAELIIDKLYTREGVEYLTWKFKPVRK